ncbi:biopolymer transporter ExbB [Asticcacaulis sp. AC460]|uniref:protein TolQ n=1 Tax=Asticcacaulis sp. AC460 TaxID=1282360 RepID=UPI0003C3E14D|nr:protein TolQ [Asticcacaulis sp. AC460]ESQ87121.1 biopolymer transporter ExbB [Asticcacaulis sp. AC460]
MSAGHASPASLDFINLFVNADLVVKVVMVILIFSSLWSWAIIVQKSLSLGKINKEADNFEAALSSGRALDDIAAALGTHPKEPFQKLLVIVTSAWRDYKGKPMNAAQGDLLMAQVDREISHVVTSEADSVEDGLSILAVIATATPFLGLFGTVWGIMNAFSAIASQGDTNLTTVAPAISEALFATAMGLFAAIPAYVAFNLFNAKVSRFATRMESFADELMVSLTRRLGEKLGG